MAAISSHCVKWPLVTNASHTLLRKFCFKSVHFLAQTFTLFFSLVNELIISVCVFSLRCLARIEVLRLFSCSS